MARSAPRTRHARLLAATTIALGIVCVALQVAAEGSRGSGGTPGTRADWPCSGCVTIVPPAHSSEAPAPLFVALHGDEGSTKVVLRLWKAPLARRGYILLALQCPKEKGCRGSFWRWAGDPAWILAQVDAVEAAYNVDRGRVYLSGWSGGSTYIGMSEPLLSPRFAAINLNAGGMSPGDAACAPCKAPVYYFMGGRNPYLSLAESARDHFIRCGREVVWDFTERLDHGGELAALSKPETQERILAWLDTKRRACLPEPVEATSRDAAEPSSPTELNGDTSVSTASSTGRAIPAAGSPGRATLPPASGSPQGCGCRGARSTSLSGVSVPAGLLAAIGRRRRRPSR